MPMRRDADGRVIHKPTWLAWRSERPAAAGKDESGDKPGGRPTEIAGPHTEVYRPGRAPGPRGGGDPAADPPVGWLVIVAGPGRGRAATLGIGNNSIGRDRTERVPLDHGDETISRTNHAVITYDPRGRKFSIQPGGGTNLIYVDDEPVLAPRELEASARLRMGHTVLRFVPLCGADFSWDDGPGGD